MYRIYFQAIQVFTHVCQAVLNATDNVINIDVSLLGAENSGAH